MSLTDREHKAREDAREADRDERDAEIEREAERYAEATGVSLVDARDEVIRSRGVRS